MYLSVYFFFLSLSLQLLPLFPSFMNWRHFFGYASLFIKALLTLDAQFMFVKIHFHNALSSIPYDELNYSLNEPIFSSSKMITRHTHTHTPNFFSWHTHSLAFVKLKASNDNDVQPTKKGKTKGKQYAISEDVQKKKKNIQHSAIHGKNEIHVKSWQWTKQLEIAI